MFDFTSSFLFPKLNFVRNDKFKHNSSIEYKFQPVYQLDMMNFYSEKSKIIDNSEKYTINNGFVSIKHYCPREIFYELTQIEYMIPPAYMSALKHCFSVIINELGFEYSKLDTIVREHCYTIKNSAIDTLFYLLSDCIYDKSSMYYDRKISNIIYSKLLWSFWANQTGSALLEDRCKIKVLKDILYNQYEWIKLDDEGERIYNYVNFFNTYISSIDKNRDEK